MVGYPLKCSFNYIHKIVKDKTKEAHMKRDYQDQYKQQQPNQQLATFNEHPNIQTEGEDQAELLLIQDLVYDMTQYLSLEEYYEKPLLDHECEVCHEKLDRHEIDEHQKLCWQSSLAYQQFQKEIKQQRCSLCNELLTGTEPEQHIQACLMQQCKCSLCSHIILRCQFDEHYLYCPGLRKQCNFCGAFFDVQAQEQHDKECIAQQKQQKQVEEKIPAQKINAICMWCHKEIEEYLSHLDHESMCSAYFELYENLEKMRFSKPLSQIQFNALQYLQRKSAEMHVKQIEQMNQICGEVGITPENLAQIVEYITEQAPIIIHFNLDKSLSHFLKDSQYRNLFQTNSSGGSKSKSSRLKWQQYLFDDCYQFAQDSQRVKYGVINFVNDIKGNKACSGYGASYLVLNKNIRKRCTITNKRKYGPGQIVTTLKYCYPVLSKFNKNELEAIYLASQGYSIESKDFQYFKEVHIHGPISFIQDVECIYAPVHQLKKYKLVVELFEAKFGVPIYPICQL